MTFLEAINAVLRRLREDEVVSTNSTDYSKLIGDFVNQSMREVENAWDWTTLTQTYILTTTVGLSLHDFTSGYTNDRMRIKYVANVTAQRPLLLIDDITAFRYERFPENTTGSVRYYWLRNHNDAAGTYDNIRMLFYPTPDVVETIKILLVNLSQDRELDGTDDSEEFVVSSHLVVLGAYARAIAERGEDGGISTNRAYNDYQMALSDTIALDSSNKHPIETTWNAI